MERLPLWMLVHEILGTWDYLSSHSDLKSKASESYQLLDKVFKFQTSPIYRLTFKLT